MMRAALALLIAALPGSALAEERIEDYGVCLARAVAHFEMELTRSRNAASEPDFEIVTRDRVDYCGTLAIVTCDRSGAPLDCQDALALRQADLRRAVLAQTPAPDAVRGIDPIWSDGLYPQLWAVAHGTSAGPDCDGADDGYAAWCETRQAALKLSEAVMLWQVARVLGAAGSAVDAGWAEVPPPPMPTQRPAEATR
jgi:hypothetical protein